MQKMLVNIFAKNKDDLEFSALYFDTKFNYKIGVTCVNFQLGDSTGVRDRELFCLNTNLIDLTANNSAQTIVHLLYEQRREIQNKQIPFVQYHTLQMYEFENASFEFWRLLTNTRCDLKFLFLQLEIKKVDSYGRI
jgi:hypothetical protein